MLPQLTSGSDGVVRAQNIVLLLIANFNMALVVMQTKYLLVYLQQVFLDQQAKSRIHRERGKRLLSACLQHLSSIIATSPEPII